MNGFDETAMKIEINNFLWMHLHADTTLEEGEKIAMAILDTIKRNYTVHDTHQKGGAE